MKIQIGHILMAMGILLGMVSVAVLVGHVTPELAIRVFSGGIIVGILIPSLAFLFNGR